MEGQQDIDPQRDADIREIHDAAQALQRVLEKYGAKANEAKAKLDESVGCIVGVIRESRYE